MLVKTNVDISIEINHGTCHFVQMLRRRESGASALIGQTQQILVLMLCFASERKHKRKRKEKEKF